MMMEEISNNNTQEEEEGEIDTKSTVEEENLNDPGSFGELPAYGENDRSGDARGVDGLGPEPPCCGTLEKRSKSVDKKTHARSA